MPQVGEKRRNMPGCCIYHKLHIGPNGSHLLHSADQFRLLGDAISAIGTPAFPRSLAAFVRNVAPYDFTVVFGYRGTARPIDLFDDFPAGKRRIFVTDYQEGPYLLDPFFLAATRPVEDGLYRMRDLAPDRFYHGEYFRSYYVRTGLAEEIGYFTEVPGSAMVVLSLMRAERSFTARDIRALEAIRPAVQASIRRQWARLADDVNPRRPVAERAVGGRIEQSFQSFGEGILTPRERQIVEYTLKGHSAEAVGRMLDISPGTVRIHRRNIYGKLQISSQGELFSHFIASLGRI
jgi:DNA-binding CsgD family transcriptional regulator